MSPTVTSPTPRWSRAVHLAAVLLIVMSGALAVTTASTIAVPDIANATCSGGLDGKWRNIDASTRSMTRVDLTMRTCGDTTACDAETGQCTHSQTTYMLRAYGKCHPTDCDWGARITTSMGGEWHRAIYQHSWATKYVWVKSYQYSGRTYLRVWVFTDFTPADGRQDYTSDVWMLR